MASELWTDIDLDISISDILRGQGIVSDTNRANRPQIVQAAQSALDLGTPLIQPITIIRQVQIRSFKHNAIQLDGNLEITGREVVMRLAGASHLWAAICTIGKSLEAECTARMAADPLLALALDGIGNAAIEKLGQKVCERVGLQTSRLGLETSSAVSPGDPDWPVAVGQNQLFALLLPPARVITLEESGMMLPQKSISFILGAGPKMQKADACSFCSLRSTCRYRVARAFND